MLIFELNPDILFLVPKDSAFPVSIAGLIVLWIISIQEIRQTFVGRVTIFSNTIFLWEILYPYWDIIPSWLHLWLYISLIVGIIAIVAWIFKESLKTIFYNVAFITNGTLTSTLLILYFWFCIL